MKTKRDFGPVLTPRHRFMVVNLILSALLMSGLGVYLNQLGSAQQPNQGNPVRLNANGQHANITVSANSTVTLQWITNSPDAGSAYFRSCSASGSWSGQKNVGGGSEKVNVGSSGTRTYTITCYYDERNVGGSDTRKVTVRSPAPAPPPPAPAPNPTPPPPPAPAPNPTPPPPPAPARRTKVPVDKTAPSMPAELSANIEADAIVLSWRESTDNKKLSGYNIERSTDQSNWQILATTYTDIIYRDSEVTPGITYFYRLQAIDKAGNKSAYASVTFEAPSTLEIQTIPDNIPWYRRIGLPPISWPFGLAAILLFAAVGIYLFFRRRHQADIRMQQYIKEQYFNDYGMRRRL